MPRIVAGAARGRRLAVPAGDGTRPTSDRAREGLFSTVHSVLGPLAAARVLDLYAGSGAIGLEALSRGASHVLLVEKDARAVRVVRANIAAVALSGAEVRQLPVERALATGPGAAYDLVVADPPYALPDQDVTALLERLRDGGWLVPNALVVIERSTRGEALRWPAGYVQDRVRTYGEGTLWYGRPAPPYAAPPDPTPDDPAMTEGE